MLPFGAAVGALAMLVAGPAHAISKCTSSKWGGVAKKASSKAKCYQKAQTKLTLDPACISKAEATYASGWAKAEAKADCAVPPGDAAAIEAKIDAFIVDLITELAPSGNTGSKCTAAKLGAAGKKASAKGKCRQKEQSKGALDPVCISKAEATYASGWGKAETKGDCQTTGDQAAIEAKIDAFILDVNTELTSIPCCNPERITLTSGAGGTLTVDGLPAFPFPAGVTTVMDVAAALDQVNCQHPVSINAFSVPTFPIPALNYCSRVTPSGCSSSTGGKIWTGNLWDGKRPASPAQTSALVTADSSDGVCDPGGPCNSGPGGIGANSLGDIDLATAPNPTGGARSLIEIPVKSLTWIEQGCVPSTDPNCTGGNPTLCCCFASSFGDEGGDVVITNFNFVLRPSTNTASAAYADKNMDGCSLAGSGPDAPPAVVGAPPPGPCCVVGQTASVAAAGAALSGAAPLFDLSFTNTIPNTVSACGGFVAGSCTPSANPCDF
jgi:hypothetical protein